MVVLKYGCVHKIKRFFFLEWMILNLNENKVTLSQCHQCQQGTYRILSVPNCETYKEEFGFIQSNQTQNNCKINEIWNLFLCYKIDGSMYCTVHNNETWTQRMWDLDNFCDPSL